MHLYAGFAIFFDLRSSQIIITRFTAIGCILPIVIFRQDGTMHYTPVNTEIRSRPWNKHHTMRPMLTALLAIAALALMSTHCSE
ncbi:MAG: hypothetical protein KDK27_15535, partial [Leptospiraceae bacterium]|nr:hypothetical protein [Leptospiraceae bacterium]